jgi:hypothetical protein
MLHRPPRPFSFGGTSRFGPLQSLCFSGASFLFPTKLTLDAFAGFGFFFGPFFLLGSTFGIFLGLDFFLSSVLETLLTRGAALVDNATEEIVCQLVTRIFTTG